MILTEDVLFVYVTRIGGRWMFHESFVDFFFFLNHYDFCRIFLQLPINNEPSYFRWSFESSHQLDINTTAYSEDKQTQL